MADTSKPRAPRQPTRLNVPAKILKDPGGQEYVMRGDKKHTPPGGGSSFSDEHKTKFNYHRTDEFHAARAAYKESSKQARAARAKKPSFSPPDQGGSHTTVSWQGGQSSAQSEPKAASAAKTHAVAMTSQSVKDSITSSEGATPRPIGQKRDYNPRAAHADAGGRFPNRAEQAAATSKAENATTRENPKLGYAKVPAQTTTQPVLSQTRPQQVSRPAPPTRQQPAAPKKSFDAHADEAMAMGNQGKNARSYSEHVDEAVAMGNSGRSVPAAQSARVPSRPTTARPSNTESLPAPAARTPQPEPSAPNRNLSGSQFVPNRNTGEPTPVRTTHSADRRGRLAAQREADRRGTPRSETPSPAAPRQAASPRFVESGNVDAVSGLEPSRATRKAVKAGRKLDAAESTHAKSARYRAGKEAEWQQTREASKRQGPVDRLVNGPKERPDKTLGPVGHAARKAASSLGAANSDRRLRKVQGKYEKAKASAEVVHDQIRSGARRGSNSDIGAVAGAAGRTIGRIAKGAAHAVAETVKGDVAAVKLAHREITGDTPTGRRIDAAWEKRQQSQGPTGGRAPRPQGQPNRNVNPDQFRVNGGRSRTWGGGED